MPERQPYLSELPTAILLPPEPEDLTAELAARVFSTAAIDDLVRSIRAFASPAPHTEHTPARAAVLGNEARNGR